MILIDSDVYAIHLMYPRDVRFSLNQDFVKEYMGGLGNLALK